MPTLEQIRTRAHQLWEQAGRPEGQDDALWHQAERELWDEEIDQAAQPDSSGSG